MPDSDSQTQGQVRAFEKLVLKQLRILLSSLFDQADSVLPELVEASSNGDAWRSYKDCLALLNGARDSIIADYAMAVGKKLIPADDKPTLLSATAFEINDLSLQDPTSLDRKILADRVGGRADHRYTSILQDINPRLDTWTYTRGANIVPEALSPPNLCALFVDALDSLKLETEQIRIALELFETICVPKFEDLYKAVLEELTSMGIQPYTRALARPGSAAGTSSGGAAPSSGQPAQAGGDGSAGTPNAGAGGGGGGGGPAGPQLDAQTRSLLQNLSAQYSNSAPYNDARLAHDLQQIAQGQSVTGWSVPAAADALRRSKAVGRVFRKVNADRHVRPELKDSFAQMQFPVMKVAMADSDFFMQNDHPLRGLLNEVLSLMARSRISTDRGAANIEQMVEQIREQFDIDASKVRPKDGEQLEPAATERLEAFAKQQKAAVKARREDIIARSREVATDELWARTAQRNLPDSARRICAYGWIPMAALNLLRHGNHSQQWESALDLLDRIVEAVDPQGEGTSDMAKLGDDFRDALGDAGMVPKRIEVMVRDLIKAICMAEDRDVKSQSLSVALPELPSAPVQRMDALLERMFVAGSWFKVHDSQLGHIQWLRAASHDQDGLEFAAFDGSRQRVTRKQFAEDLLAGLSDPVDPTPPVENELLAIRAATAPADANTDAH